MKFALKSIAVLMALGMSTTSYGTQIGPDGNHINGSFQICHTRVPDPIDGKEHLEQGHFVVSHTWLTLYYIKCDANDNGTISIGSFDSPTKYWIQGDCTAVRRSSRVCLQSRCTRHLLW